MPTLNTGALLVDRLNAIRTHHANTGLARAQIDVSGGVDSAVILGLLAQALEPENVTAVYSDIHSSTESLERAREVCETFKVRLIETDLTDFFEKMHNQAMGALNVAGYPMDVLIPQMRRDPTICGSFRSCLRAPWGRYMNRLTGGGLRHGTGNECEDRWLRFYQKGGDGEVDLNAIAMLSKGEVFQLGRILGVPKSILQAKPTPDLWGFGGAHTDEDELRNLTGVGWTYSRVDPNTGEYTYVGTIERLSRFLDHEFPAWFDDLCRITGAWLFAEPSGNEEISGPWELDLVYLTEQAMPFFEGVEESVQRFLESARQVERSTRHKMNPNCPTLGDRESLLAKGILTNTLPKV